MRTIAPSIENRLAEHHRGLPVWIRASKSGQEYYTGLSRGKLYQLASRGLIRSFSLRDPGNLKGCRFFHLQSILDYTRAPSATNSAAIDPIFSATSFTNEGGQTDWPWYWSSTRSPGTAGTGTCCCWLCWLRQDSVSWRWDG